MKPEELSHTITELCKATKEGKADWRIEVQTTEKNEEKYIVTEEGTDWQLDECYVSYLCSYQGKEFCLITYEMIKTAQNQVKTTNFIFMPPMGIRLFSLHTLLPYSVKADRVLISQVHMLWMLLIDQYKAGDRNITLSVSSAEVMIEDDEEEPEE